MDFPYRFLIFVDKLKVGRYMFFRHDENMDRRLRVDIVESVESVCLRHFFRRYFTRDDFTKKAIVHAQFYIMYEVIGNILKAMAQGY